MMEVPAEYSEGTEVSCHDMKNEDSYMCYARSMDLRNPGIALRKPWIHGLFAQSRDCTNVLT